MRDMQLKRINAVTLFFKFASYSFLFVALFLYVYNIAFAFAPMGIRTRMLLGVLGIIVYLNYFLNNSTICKITLFNFIFIALAIVSLAVNQTSDYWFIQFSVLNIIYISSAVLLSFLLNKFSISFYQLCFFLIFVILFHNLIAFYGFINSDIRSLILDLQQPITANNVYEEYEEIRSIGFGLGNFFIGGGISGFAIILSIYLYLKRKISIVLFSILLSLLVFTGVFIARTTLLGLIGFVLLFKEQSLRSYIKYIFSSIVVVLILYLIFFFVVDNASFDYNWAFEPILNLLNEGSLQTSSTDTLKTMYVWPDNFKTWLIGDTLFENANGSYYKETDVGYLRVIYYFGLVGLYLFLFYQYWMLRLITKASDLLFDYKIASILFIYVLLLNLKGFFDINYVSFLFLAFWGCQNKSCVRNEYRILD